MNITNLDFYNSPESKKNVNKSPEKILQKENINVQM